MIYFAARGFWIGVVAICVVLGLRTLWIAAGNETGLETLAQVWKGATIGQVISVEKPLSRQSAFEQANLFLDEIFRVMEDHSDDAEVAMGAALALDTQVSHMGPFDDRRPILPYDGIYYEPAYEDEEIFVERIRNKTIELAARACAMEPSKSDWRRLKALVLLRDSSNWPESLPSVVEWNDILDECAVHDPPNGLYAYLKARFLLNVSSEWDHTTWPPSVK